MTWTGRRLREARAKRGIRSQRELAELIGSSPRSVAAWERDEAKPQAHWAGKLDELFADPTPDSGRPASDPRVSEASFTALLAGLARNYAELEAEVAALRAELAAHRPPRNIRLPTERLKMYSPDERNPATPGSGQAGETDDRAL